MLREFSATNACFTRDEPSSKPVGGVGLGPKQPNYVRGVRRAPKPPSLRSSRCIQSRAAEATAHVAAVGKYHRYRARLSSTICHRVGTSCWQAGLGMCHAVLRREAAAVMAAKFNVGVVVGYCWGTWYGCVGVCGLFWWDERCDGYLHNRFRLKNPPGTSSRVDDFFRLHARVNRSVEKV